MLTELLRAKLSEEHISTKVSGMKELAYSKYPSKKEIYYSYKVHVLTTIDGYISRYIIQKQTKMTVRDFIL